MPKSKEKKTVTIKLFKDSKEYKDPVFVSVNGENYLIKRGVEVEVTPAVAEVLQNAQHQEDRTIELIRKTEEDYRGKSK